jgi:hypothetical protein
MFYNNTMMSIANMDNTLRGWAKLDTAAGETAIQSNVIVAFVKLEIFQLPISWLKAPAS